MKIEEFIDIAIENTKKKLKTEEIEIINSMGRIISEDIHSMSDLPPFSRSVMDGYAVISKDTYGASESVPIFLELDGEVKMGEEAINPLKKGYAIKIATGAMMPLNADAVVMVEDTEMISDTTIEMSRSVYEKENIVFKGEDIASGEILLKKSHKIRPQDIGALAGIGVTKIQVYKKVKVAIFSTGDELIEPSEKPKLGQIRDINSYSISSFALKEGAEVEMCGIIKDDKDKLLNEIKLRLSVFDIILLSGGSSVGTRDLTINVLEELQKDSILAHGIAIKPGKPTILSVIKETLIIGLPGHPASSIVVFNGVVKPLIKILSGEISEMEYENKIMAKLSRNLVSDKGREQYFRVNVKKQGEEYIVTPVLGKSSLITTLVKANGLLKCNLGSEGILKGTIVEVILFS
jgi:molybdopterin molybdotransferase